MLRENQLARTRNITLATDWNKPTAVVSENCSPLIPFLYTKVDITSACLSTALFCNAKGLSKFDPSTLPRASIKSTTMVGLMEGSVMFHIFCHLLAPSTEAASYSSGEIPDIAARYMMEFQPKDCHTPKPIYVATHPDYNCPTRTGFIPDIGSLSAYVEASTGRRPDKVVGKPEAEIIDYALRTMGASKEETCVVGDRLYTDVKSGVNNGLYGIFVLSGEAQLEDLADSDVKPHLIFDSVKEIIPYL